MARSARKIPHRTDRGILSLASGGRILNVLDRARRKSSRGCGAGGRAQWHQKFIGIPCVKTSVVIGLSPFPLSPVLSLGKKEQTEATEKRGNTGRPDGQIRPQTAGSDADFPVFVAADVRRL